LLSSALRPLAYALAVLAIFTAGAVACSDDDDEGADAQDGSTDARLERVEVLAALNTLDATEFHAIDEELQEADEIPEFTASTIERALQVSSSTQWPEDLSEKADTLNTTMEEFIAAMEAEDLQESKGLATDTHDAWHELEHDAYPWVAGEELEEEEEEEGEETEAAEETEEAEQDDEEEEDGEASPTS
jgi:hypothetical protein